MNQHGWTFAFLAGICALGAIELPEAQAAGKLSARQIMDRVITTRKLDGSEATVKMTIYDENGHKRERDIAMATKLFDKGKTEKRVYRFLSPPDVQGTGILIFDYESRPDDMWIYLPALRKTRRILSSQGSQSFMGSEFSYADITVPALDDFNYTSE